MRIVEPARASRIIDAARELVSGRQSSEIAIQCPGQNDEVRHGRLAHRHFVFVMYEPSQESSRRLLTVAQDVFPQGKDSLEAEAVGYVACGGSESRSQSVVLGE